MNAVVDTAVTGCNNCRAELLLSVVLRKPGEGVGGRRRVRAPAVVTTWGTRALGVGLGDRPLQVGPRCGYIRGTHAE